MLLRHAKQNTSNELSKRLTEVVNLSNSVANNLEMSLIIKLLNKIPYLVKASENDNYNNLLHEHYNKLAQEDQQQLKANLSKLRNKIKQDCLDLKKYKLTPEERDCRGLAVMFPPVFGIILGLQVAYKQNLKDAKRALSRVDQLLHVIECKLEVTDDAKQKNQDYMKIIEHLNNIKTRSTGLNEIKDYVKKNPGGPAIFAFMQKTILKRKSVTPWFYAEPKRSPELKRLYSLMDFDWNNHKDRLEVINTLASLDSIAPKNENDKYKAYGYNGDGSI